MCVCVYVSIYILYSGICPQALTNIYFQHKWNPELQKPINPFLLLIGFTSVIALLVHTSLSLSVNTQDGRGCALLTRPWMQACRGQRAGCGHLWLMHSRCDSVSEHICFQLSCFCLSSKPFLSPVWKQLPGGKMIQSDIWVPLGMCMVIPFLPSCN